MNARYASKSVSLNKNKATCEHVRLDKSISELLARLGASPESGLSSTEAMQRLEKRRSNEPRYKQLRSKIFGFLRASFNPLIIILLIAGTASAFLGDVNDAIIIAIIVFLSSGIDFWQTFRSERAAKQLQKQIMATATARRDSKWMEIPREEVVDGDIIRISAGDLVPADARLIESNDLHVQQSALTGESLPVEKTATTGTLGSIGPDSPALVFLGTSIVSGTATAVVFASGQETTFGDIVERLSDRPEETEFEHGSRRFGMLILRTVFFLVLFITVVNLILGRNALQSLMFSVALAVGLTPEFLPMITSVTLTQGAVWMARKKVIVKHIASIQNLGSIDIICSDKTGTLTTGQMSFDTSFDPFGKVCDRPIFLGYLNSRFESGIKSPLDAAILEHPVTEADGFSKVSEIPFDFERRRLSVLVEKEGMRLLISKGAPESVLGVCTKYEADGSIHEFDKSITDRCTDVFRGLSERGFRVLAVAFRQVPSSNIYSVTDEREMILTGFLTFADHLLEGTAKAIESLRHDGVEVKILTGDNELVSNYICKQVGIHTDRVVLGSEIEHMDQHAFQQVMEQSQIFARVSPSQKHQIITTLKQNGHVVGFLGDGINDAPSLHSADVGISAAGATDIAREASDIILLERNLDVLHGGILTGRHAFANVYKYLLMGTSSNFGNMFSMAGASWILPFLPMLPTQILLNNMLYDIAQLPIPTDNVDPFFLERPQRYDISVIKRFMIWIGPVSSIFDFLTFFVMLRVFHFTETLFQTGWFVESLSTQVLVLFVIRTVGKPWSSRPSIPLAITAFIVVIAGLIIPYSPVARFFRMAPLPPAFLSYVAMVVLVYLLLVEVVKERLLRYIMPNNRVKGS